MPIQALQKTRKENYGVDPQNEMNVPEEQKDPMTEYDVQILPEDKFPEPSKKPACTNCPKGCTCKH